MTPNGVQVIVRRATRYRIYPTVEQTTRLSRWQDALRFLWNLAHEQRLQRIFPLAKGLTRTRVGVPKG